MKEKQFPFLKTAYSLFANFCYDNNWHIQFNINIHKYRKKVIVHTTVTILMRLLSEVSAQWVYCYAW